uniref:Uncharacterized protein n=1 Tax=Setaria italica TaxID=4555 RepID=K3Y0H4_SETIT
MYPQRCHTAASSGPAWRNGLCWQHASSVGSSNGRMQQLMEKETMELQRKRKRKSGLVCLPTTISTLLQGQFCGSIDGFVW